jgi:hypothetical protein
MYKNVEKYNKLKNINNKLIIYYREEKDLKMVDK